MQSAAGLVLLVVAVIVFAAPALGQVTELPSLREIYKDYFDLGAAVSIAGWSDRTLDKHRDLLAHHFNSITAGNEMKPDATQPCQGPSNSMTQTA